MPLAAFLPLPSFPSTTLCTHSSKCSRCSVTLPSNYDILRDQATLAVKNALSSNVSLIEVQFPPVPNIATAALNQLLDANRSFARPFLQSIAPKYPPGSVIAVFPDHGEAKLARKAYGQVPFDVVALPKKDISTHLLRGEGVCCVINPGFNVDEWIRMEMFQGGDKALVCLNGDLDKVRGSYYPKLFYPGLWKVKTRFLTNFESVYYVKMFAGGGVVFRCFPDPWKVFVDGDVVWEGEQRPDFEMVQKLISNIIVKKRNQ